MTAQIDAREGGHTRGQLMEAGAHLWLAEELRACAGLLSDVGAADPRTVAEKLDELAQALQAEGAAQRWEAGGGAYGNGGVSQASRAATCLHRASQLRHASQAVMQYAQALRHGGARGWVTVFGAGGLAACDPSVVPNLLMLADSETALARAKARPHSRPGARDHAHAPLSSNDGGDDHLGVHAATVRHRQGSSGGRSSTKLQVAIDESGQSATTPRRATSGGGAPPWQRPVHAQASAHCRRRLADAQETLTREASLVADAAPVLPPPPPDTARVAARVLAGGGQYTPSYRWTGADGAWALGKGAGVSAALWGSTIHPQHGGTWLGSGWKWRASGTADGNDGASSADDDAEFAAEEARLDECAVSARKALRKSRRLAEHWEPENGTCVRCVERHVRQAPTFLSR